MLLNLSNHPSEKWSQEQRVAAQGLFGTIIDVAFPSIEPAASLEEIQHMVQDYVRLCLTYLNQYKEDTKENAVHIMGEFTFTYLFVREMQSRGVPCVASTTERIVSEDPLDPAKKVTTFRFVQFRPYFTD